MNFAQFEAATGLFDRATVRFKRKDSDEWLSGYLKYRQDHVGYDIADLVDVENNNIASGVHEEYGGFRAFNHVWISGIFIKLSDGRTYGKGINPAYGLNHKQLKERTGLQNGSIVLYRANDAADFQFGSLSFSHYENSCNNLACVVTLIKSDGYFEKTVHHQNGEPNKVFNTLQGYKIKRIDSGDGWV